jgi:phage gp36-like protein
MPIADGKFFTWKELSARLSNTAARRVFDDDRDGIADDDAVNRLISDADSETTAHASKNYPSQVDSTITPSNAHPYLKKLALDYAEAEAHGRFPSIFRHHDPDAELERAMKRLQNLALGKTKLEGVEQASNSRAVVRNGARLGGSTKKVFGDFGCF